MPLSQLIRTATVSNEPGCWVSRPSESHPWAVISSTPLPVLVVNSILWSSVGSGSAGATVGGGVAWRTSSRAATTLATVTISATTATARTVRTAGNRLGVGAAGTGAPGVDAGLGLCRGGPPSGAAPAAGGPSNPGPLGRPMPGPVGSLTPPRYSATRLVHR